MDTRTAQRRSCRVTPCGCPPPPNNRRRGRAGTSPAPTKTRIDGHSHRTAQIMWGRSEVPLSCGTLPRIIVNLNHCKGATASDCVVITDSLTRVHGDATALSGLTLLVQEHSIFGFPGTNGAGKSRR